MSGFNLSNAPQPPTEQPLGLTVHALPLPGDAMARPGRVLRGRWTMLALLLACAAPVLVSYFTYYVVRPEGRRVFGELIEPQRPLPAIATSSLDAQNGRLTDLKGQWLLLSVAGGACDAACAGQLYLQRQLREGLGKDKDRLDWVWLVPDQTAVAEALLPALKDATVLRVPNDQLAAWLVPAPGQRLEAHLYVVDPMGNWMMRFPASLDASGAARAKRDLERLLRASAFWDQPGREPGK